MLPIINPADKNTLFAMKHAFQLTILALALAAASQAAAQNLGLPRPSPPASLSYTLGYTDIAIRYGAPAVDGRDIWGALVPYGKIWRAGANEATVIAFSTAVEIEGQPLPAGQYAFFLIPQESGPWTAIFNREAEQWGAYRYRQEADALRVEVEARFSKAAADERLQYSIVAQDADNGYIRLAWEHLRLYLRVKVNTVDSAMAQVQQALASAPEGEKWNIHAQAANFLLWAGQPARAQAQAERSIALKANSWNYWLKARSQAAQNDFAAALQAAQQARRLGQDEGPEGFFARSEAALQPLIERWQSQLKSGSRG
jgi:tetratricopeptide (TPR) repeat protein